MNHGATRAVGHRFGFTEPLDVRWTPRFPEVGSVANAISLAMPHIEPFVIRTVLEARAQGTAGLAASGADDEWGRFAREEAAHHKAHRRYNVHVAQQYRFAWTVDRFNRGAVACVSRLPLRLRTGFAAGFEALGLAAAMWLGPRAELLLAASNPTVRWLFIWHLVEEVGHRDVALDVHRSVHGGWPSRLIGLLLAMVVLGVGALLGAVVAIVADRRWYRPVAWSRLIVWALSFLWSSGPMLMSFVLGDTSRYLVPGEVLEWESDLLQVHQLHADPSPSEHAQAS